MTIDRLIEELQRAKKIAAKGGDTYVMVNGVLVDSVVLEHQHNHGEVAKIR